MVVAASMEPSTRLKNRYWVLRHGRSVPNEAGLIVSHMSNGVLPIYGLAPSGFLQAEEAGALLFKELEVEGIPLDHVRIFASPFRRTVETAETVVTSLHTVASAKPSIKFVDGLRERYFGPPLELKSHEHYPEIWAIDAIDPMVGPNGGESVADIALESQKLWCRWRQMCKGVEFWWSVMVTRFRSCKQLCIQLCLKCLVQAMGLSLLIWLMPSLGLFCHDTASMHCLPESFVDSLNCLYWRMPHLTCQLTRGSGSTCFLCFIFSSP